MIPFLRQRLVLLLKAGNERFAQIVHIHAADGKAANPLGLRRQRCVQIAGIIIAQIEPCADLRAENGAIFAVQANHLPVLRNLLGGFVLRQQKQGNILTIAVRQGQVVCG